MSLTTDDVKKIANLAKLNLSEDDIKHLLPQLSNILHLVEQMNAVDTTNILPLSHPLDISQRLRQDLVTESDLRAEFQAIAPQVEAGLYMVPKVIESE